MLLFSLVFQSFLASVPLTRAAAQDTSSRGPSGSESYAQESYSLADLIRVGREQNPHLLSLRAGRASMEAARRDAGRLLNPELEFATGEGDAFESSETKSLRELGLSQTIPNPLARHYRMGALKSEVAAAGEGVRFGAIGVDYEIRLHFYRILYLQELLEVAGLNEDALEEVRGLIETRARAGEVRELEAIRLRVEHMRAQNQVQAVELELAQFRQHLNSGLGTRLVPIHNDYITELTVERAAARVLDSNLSIFLQVNQ